MNRHAVFAILDCIGNGLEAKRFGSSREVLNNTDMHEIAISMDGRGRWMDNVFIERLWRSVKYEEVYLKGYEASKNSNLGCN